MNSSGAHSSIASKSAMDASASGLRAERRKLAVLSQSQVFQRSGERAILPPPLVEEQTFSSVPDSERTCASDEIVPVAVLQVSKVSFV
mmetsp:Transcript_21638/g.63543  ORF Transcript_21638/g.63543 Transcript_21638/m.63543 type:complete len:88 (+) Transcript_21638:2627-2890(+)